MPTIFLTAEDGKFITTEDGTFIILDGYFYPIFMALSNSFEFGIIQLNSFEYNIKTDILTEFKINKSKSFEYDMRTDASVEYNAVTLKTGGG